MLRSRSAFDYAHILLDLDGEHGGALNGNSVGIAPLAERGSVLVGTTAPNMSDYLEGMLGGKSAEEAMYGSEGDAPAAPVTAGAQAAAGATAQPATPANAGAPATPAAAAAAAPAAAAEPTFAAPKTDLEVANLLMQSPDPRIKAQGARMLADIHDPPKAAAPAAPAAPAGPTRAEVEKGIKDRVEVELVKANRLVQRDASGQKLYDPDTEEPVYESMDDARKRLGKDTLFKEVLGLKQERAVEAHGRTERIEAQRQYEQRELETFIDTQASEGVRQAIYEAIPSARVEGGKVNDAVVAAWTPMFEGAVVNNMRQFDDAKLAQVFPEQTPAQRQRTLVQWAVREAKTAVAEAVRLSGGAAPAATPAATVVQVPPAAAAAPAAAAIPPAIGPSGGASPFAPPSPEQVNQRNGIDRMALHGKGRTFAPGGMAETLLPRAGVLNQ